LKPRDLVPFLAVACLALPAAAHEVTSEVVRGQAVAVRALAHDGAAFIDATAEVFSPSSDATPSWRGRTDRNGWIAFVPDAPGRWRVRVVDATGHGIVTDVDVPAPGAAGTPPASAPAPSAMATVARPLIGVALVAAIFGFLHFRGRGKGR
jgi:nickel transport protein